MTSDHADVCVLRPGGIYCEQCKHFNVSLYISVPIHCFTFKSRNLELYFPVGTIVHDPFIVAIMQYQFILFNYGLRIISSHISWGLGMISQITIFIWSLHKWVNLSWVRKSFTGFTLSYDIVSSQLIDLFSTATCTNSLFWLTCISCAHTPYPYGVL